MESMEVLLIPLVLIICHQSILLGICHCQRVHTHGGLTRPVLTDISISCKSGMHRLITQEHQSSLESATGEIGCAPPHQSVSHPLNLLPEKSGVHRLIRASVILGICHRRNRVCTASSERASSLESATEKSGVPRLIMTHIRNP